MLKRILTDKYIKNKPMFNPKPNDKILFISNLLSGGLGILISIIIETISIISFYQIYELKNSFNLILSFIVISSICYLEFTVGLSILENAYKSYYNKKE